MRPPPPPNPIDPLELPLPELGPLETPELPFPSPDIPGPDIPAVEPENLALLLDSPALPAPDSPLTPLIIDQRDCGFPCLLASLPFAVEYLPSCVDGEVSLPFPPCPKAGPTTTAEPDAALMVEFGPGRVSRAGLLMLPLAVLEESVKLPGERMLFLLEVLLLLLLPEFGGRPRG